MSARCISIFCWSFKAPSTSGWHYASWFIGLPYQDLIRSKTIKAGERLPAIFPVVPYNGRRKWTAAKELAALIDAPAGLADYQPNLRYWLFEERSIPAAALAQDNTMAHIVRIEQSQYPEELCEIVKRLNIYLREPRFAELRRALTVWMRHVVLQRLAPGTLAPEMRDLEEVMLAETVEEWVEHWKREGLEQGRHRVCGRAYSKACNKGLLGGEAKVLERQLSRRFGPLTEGTRRRLRLATVEQLEYGAERLLEAESLEEVFQGP